MNEITVIISGIVMLVSTNAFVQNGTADISAAVAVEASQPFDSSYDVDVPLHMAMLKFKSKDVAVIKDPENRLKEVIVEGSDAVTLLHLHGDRIQLGTGQGACAAATAKTPAARDSAKGIPRLSEIVRPDLKLAPKTFPTGARLNDFTKVSKDLVAAWLEIAGGHLRAVQPEFPETEEVQFRPSRRRAILSPAVEWRLPSGQADCIIVTPFSGADPIVLAFVPDNAITVDFENMADRSTGEAVPGIGYDYELFYRLIENPPVIPPIPYGLVNVPNEGSNPGPDGLTGVNCGPVRIR
jgi:hypothetical protein